MKSITVQSLTEKFQLEVLAGADRMDRLITRAQTHRPGLEFVGYFNFFLWSECRCLDARKLTTCLRLV